MGFPESLLITVTLSALLPLTFPGSVSTIFVTSLLHLLEFSESLLIVPADYLPTFPMLILAR